MPKENKTMTILVMLLLKMAALVEGGFGNFDFSSHFSDIFEDFFGDGFGGGSSKVGDQIIEDQI